MPKAGDKFVTTLKRAHLEWGSHRHTNSRGIRYGEGYLQIPASIARSLFITNNNRGTSAIYLTNTSDGYLQDVKLLAAGCSIKGDIYAKQFQGKGKLTILGDWFNHLDLVAGDQIEIKFVSPTEILLTKI